MSKPKFTISNDSSDESVKDDLIRFKSYLDMFKSIQKTLVGSEVNGKQYGGLLLLNNLILCLESLYQTYENENYLATLALNRHFIDLFMDVRVTVEDISTSERNPKLVIGENLRKYAGLILWKETKYHDDIITEKTLDKDDPVHIGIIEASAITWLYYKSVIFELGLNDVIEMIENRKDRRIPPYRNLVIRKPKKHSDFQDLHYPWSRIEFKRGSMISHGEYNTLRLNKNSCVADKENINYSPVLIKPQLTKLHALEHWIRSMYRVIWPEIAWGKLFPKVKKYL